MKRSVLLTFVAGAILLWAAQTASAADPPLVEKFLLEGKLADGEKALIAHLKTNPTDDQARFGLGSLQFIRSIEHLGQSLHFFGALGTKARLAQQLPILRLPVPPNPKPEKITYADARRIFQNLVTDLAKADATLAGVKDAKVKLPLHFAKLRLDLDGNAKSDETEVLWKIYTGINTRTGLGQEISPADAEAFVIAFDYGDVHWLRGYCHLLSAICETALMYDQQAAFDLISYQIFDNPAAAPPAEFFIRDNRFEMDIADAIAAIHMMRFPVKEPKRGEAVLTHLKAVIELSKSSWSAIQDETDNDNEWVPNADQKSVIPNVRVTKEMIAGWHEFLKEADLLLDGKKLVPHWRIKTEHGVNLRRVFAEPREFDVVMWAHGAAAMPYIEKGDCTTAETWNRFNRIFAGEFIGFAIWFN